MAFTMNKESMNTELNEMLQENEKYKAQTWASIVTSTPKLLSYTTSQDKRPKIGATNIYCYVGLTNKNVNIVTLNSLDVTRVTGKFRIPIEDIQQFTYKNGILKCSAEINFGKEEIKVLWVNQPAGTDIKNQRKNVKVICEFISNI